MANNLPPPSLDPPQTGPLPPEWWPNIDHIKTEDDTPVDNIYSEKQQRLLTEPLYSSWAGPGENKPFLALANVGLFYSTSQPPLVPDALLSLFVRAPQDLFPRRNRSYFVWEHGKPPNVVIEVVSNREGEEAGRKLELYQAIPVPYYVIWDPEKWLGGETLRVFGLQGNTYQPLKKPWFPEAGLGLKIWHGSFEGVVTDWLRWCDEQGQVIATGAERAAAEQQRAESEHQRAERLAAKLRELGVDPTSLK